uniref:Herpesvirus envelope glycoprotein N domain-containing protein n=1 Tax=Saimiriine herpesvirus 2 TaxID=10381 RepID=Q80BH3_SHV2|nr:hypothetical protein [Saimiriine gammaherpesvirus 2]
MSWHVFICFLIIWIICLEASNSTEKSLTTSHSTMYNTKFYSNSCSADTYVPNIKTFSSVWAIVNLIEIFFACLLYLRYLCFVKFISKLTK